jgi:hypothetical protein
MISTKYVIFESDPAMIKSSGDNSGYIYNPTGLVYLGETFNILPGETIMLIPHQPDHLGPWKQRRIAFQDSQFLKCKEEETLTFMIENRCPNKVFKVSNGCSLAEILNRWGINHEMSFVTDRQIEKIEAYTSITTAEDNNDKMKNQILSRKCCDCCQSQQ